MLVKEIIFGTTLLAKLLLVKLVLLSIPLALELLQRGTINLLLIRKVIKNMTNEVVPPKFEVKEPTHLNNQTHSLYR